MFPHLAKSHILQRLTSKANVVLGGRPAGAKYLRFGGVALGPTSGIRVPHEGGVPQKVETSQMGVSRTQTDGAGVEVGGGPLHLARSQNFKNGPQSEALGPQA